MLPLYARGMPALVLWPLLFSFSFIATRNTIYLFYTISSFIQVGCRLHHITPDSRSYIHINCWLHHRNGGVHIVNIRHHSARPTRGWITDKKLWLCFIIFYIWFWKPAILIGLSVACTKGCHILLNFAVRPDKLIITDNINILTISLILAKQKNAMLGCWSNKLTTVYISCWHHMRG